ncbi:MAG: response regulator transcription factor [Planctomycetes bacterium]|nr:response regulator transcription factor [Planctomycetota bacterium]
MLKAETVGQRILIIEDEESIALGVRDALQHHGHQVDVCMDGEAGLERARADRYDLLVLDLMLPGISGFELIETLRREGSRLRIVILSAKSEESDILRGLELGADDYVCKPFSPLELLARIEAQFRRFEMDTAPPPELQLGPGLSVDLQRLEVHRQDEVIPLTPREGDILRYLVQHRGKIVTRDDLLVDVWNYVNGKVETRTVDIHIVGLRRKIEPEPAHPVLIQTVRGKGYRWHDAL